VLRSNLNFQIKLSGKGKQKMKLSKD